MSTAEILRKARGLMDTPEKWWRGTPTTAAGTCPILAIGDVVGLEVRAKRDAWAAFAQAAGLEGDADVAIPAWNDARERKHGEVLAAFDRAIADAEAQS